MCESRIKVAVLGAAGRMGRQTCETVSADSELELVAATDRSLEGFSPGAEQVAVADIETLIETQPDVVVDFTIAQASMVTLPLLAQAGIHCVVGATGFSETDLEKVGAWFNPEDRPNALIAPNFAISAVLMMRFAQIAAPFFEGAEIIELHHNNKIDAPSGTAVATAEKMAETTRGWAKDPTEFEKYEGSRGGLGPGDIRIHSVRMRGMLAHQEVILGAAGQTLTIRQDSFDRSSFMSGVILACKKIHQVPGFSYGLEPYLDL